MTDPEPIQELHTVREGTLGINNPDPGDPPPAWGNPTFRVEIPVDFDPPNAQPTSGTIMVTIGAIEAPLELFPGIPLNTQTINWTADPNNPPPVNGNPWIHLTHGGNSETGLYTLYWRSGDPDYLSIDVSYPSNAAGSQKWSQRFKIDAATGGRPHERESGA